MKHAKPTAAACLAEAVGRRRVPVEVRDALGEELRALETVADLLGMAGKNANPDARGRCTGWR